MRLALRLLLAAAASCAPAAGAAEQATGPSVRLLVQSSPLAGYRHHEAAGVWHLLRIGDRLELVREPDNPHDARAIRVDWRGHKLGYVPRRENDAIAWGMDRGDDLRARISRLDARRPASRRLEFEVYVE